MATKVTRIGLSGLFSSHSLLKSVERQSKIGWKQRNNQILYFTTRLKGCASILADKIGLTESYLYKIFMDYHPSDLNEAELNREIDEIKTSIGGGFIASLIYILPFIILL